MRQEIKNWWEEIPFELYDKPTADEFLTIAKGVLEWTEKQLV